MKERVNASQMREEPCAEEDEEEREVGTRSDLRVMGPTQSPGESHLNQALREG